MQKHLIAFCSQSLMRRKQNTYDPHKELKSEPEMIFFLTVVVRLPELVAKVPYYYSLDKRFSILSLPILQNCGSLCNFSLM